MFLLLWQRGNAPAQVEERGIEIRSGWKPNWTAQEPPNHQLFPLPKQDAKELVVGPRLHQRPPSATSAPSSPSMLRFPSTGIKHTRRPGASRVLPPRAHFLAWPAQVHPPKGFQRGPSRFPGRPRPPPQGRPAAARSCGLFLGVEGEGNGKRNRELGRWGREVRERVFPAAISSIKRDPGSLKPFLP